MRASKWLLLSSAGVALVLLAGAYVLPREAVVQRSAIIAAPPQAVWSRLNDLGTFNDWSPWARLDPAMAVRVEGPPGAGQRMIWRSRDWRVGSGSMTVVASVSGRQVAMAADFGHMGTATTVFDLAPAGGGTAVTWGFKADLGNNPLRRWSGPLHDWWVGGEYRQGLANLKELVEKERAGPGRDGG